jgi:hypothetical protein
VTEFLSALAYHLVTEYQSVTVCPSEREYESE